MTIDRVLPASQSPSAAAPVFDFFELFRGASPELPGNPVAPLHLVPGSRAGGLQFVSAQQEAQQGPGGDQQLPVPPLDALQVHDGGPAVLPSQQRDLTQRLQTTVSQLVPLLPLATVRTRLLAVLEQLPEAERAEIRQALQGDNAAVPTELLRRILLRERASGEFGPVTRALYGATVQWLNQELPNLLREFFLRSEGAPPAGCPIQLPELDGAPMEMSLFRTRVMQGQVAWTLGVNPDQPPNQASLEQLVGATRWYGECIQEVVRRDNAFNQELLAETVARLNEAPPRGISLNRPGWLEGRQSNPQGWFAAATAMVDLTQRLRNTVTAIAALRSRAENGDYPPGAGNIFAPGSPVRAECSNGRVTSLTLDLPQDLRPTPENLRKIAELQAWLDRYAPGVQQDLQRLTAVAADQDRLLYWADVPQSGRLTANPQQGITLTQSGQQNNEYNLVCPRFRVEQVTVDGSPVVRVHHTIEYYRSGPLNYMDIGATQVGTRELAHTDYGPNDMVPIMRGGSIELMPASNLADWRASQARWYHIGRGVTMALDGLMLVTGCLELGAAARAVSLAGRVAEVAVRQALREAALTSLRQGATSVALSVTGLTGNGYWQNTDIGRFVNGARQIYFTVDAFRGGYQLANEGFHLLQGGLRRVGWLSAAAEGAREGEAAASLAQNLLRNSPWHTAETAAGFGMRAAEWGLVSVLVGQHQDTQTHQGPGNEALLRLAYDGQNLGQQADRFLQAALTNLNLPAGELRNRVQELVTATGEALRGQRDAQAVANDLATRFNNTSGNEQERTMAAVGLLALANRPGQPLAEAVGGCSTASVISFLRARAATSENRTLRFVAGQALFLSSRMGFPEFAELCRAVVTDASCSREVQVQATLGIGLTMWSAQMRERTPGGSDQQGAQVAQSLNNTRIELERTLLEQARNHPHQDVRAMSVTMLQALNRDNNQQAEHLLLSAIRLWEQHRQQPGAFATHFQRSLVTTLDANPVSGVARDNPQGLHRVTAERYLAATALLSMNQEDQRRVLDVPTDVEAQRRIGQALVRCVNLTCPEIAPLALTQLLRRGQDDNTLFSQLPEAIQNQVRTRVLSILGQRTTDANAVMRAQLIGLLPDMVAGNNELCQRVSDSLSGTVLRPGHISYANAHPEVRRAAVEALGRLRLPAGVPTILAILGQAEGGTADPSPQVRLAAIQALRQLPEAVLAEHHVNLPELAASLMETEFDPAVRNALRALRDNAVQQNQPEAHQVRQERQEGQAELEGPSGPEFTQPYEWLRNDPYFARIVPAHLIASYAHPWSVQTAPRPTFYSNDNFRSATHQEITEDYRQRMQSLIRLAQGNLPQRPGAEDARNARRALAWLVNCHGVNQEALPAVVTTAISEASTVLRNLCVIGQGNNVTAAPHQAEMRPWICALAENPALPASIRLTMIDTLRDIARTNQDGSFNSRAAGVCLRVFLQMPRQEPADENRAIQHNRLLNTLMHDLAFTYNIRDARFIGRLVAMSRSATLPVSVRDNARRCLERVNDWTGAMSREALGEAYHENYVNRSAAERATALSTALSRPGVHEQPRINPANQARPIIYTQACEDAVMAIYRAAAGRPFENNDPRLPLLDNVLNSPNPRVRLAGAAALLRSDCPPPYRTRAARTLAELAEYGDRPDLGSSWRHTFLDEAQQILADYSASRAATSSSPGSADEVAQARAWVRASRQTVSLLLDQSAPDTPLPLQQRLDMVRAALANQTREADRVGVLAAACRGADLRSPDNRALRDQLVNGLADTNQRIRLVCAALLLRSGEAPALAVQTLVNTANAAQDSPIRQDAQGIVNGILADNRPLMAAVRAAIDEAGGQRREVAAAQSGESLQSETTSDGVVLQRRRLPDQQLQLISASYRSLIDGSERTVRYNYDGNVLTSVALPDGTAFERVGNSNTFRLRTNNGLSNETWTAEGPQTNGEMIFRSTTTVGNRTIERTISTRGTERRVIRQGAQITTVECRDGRVVSIETPGQTVQRRQFFYENGQLSHMDVTRNCRHDQSAFNDNREVPCTFRLQRRAGTSEWELLNISILLPYNSPGHPYHGTLVYPQIAQGLTGQVTANPDGTYSWSGPSLVCDRTEMIYLRQLHPSYLPPPLNPLPSFFSPGDRPPASDW